jgi:dolichol-phosphate mannosyltransferase
MVGLGVRAILEHSYAPLRLISLTGVALSLFSLIILVTTSILFIFQGVPFPGFGTIISVIILLFGILLLMLGIISEYLALVYQEVKRRPLFLIDEKINIK